MNKFSFLAHIVAALTGLHCAHAESVEKLVSFQVEQQNIVGTLQLPVGLRSPPVVLLLHGFGGSRDEMATPFVKEGIFAHAAKAWADKGYASLRIDFRGAGQSDGKFEDTTISGQVNDALAAIEYLQSEKTVDATRLALVGWSQGGAVAAVAAGRTARPVRAVVLWAPVAVPSTTLPGLLGHEYVKSGLASGGRTVSTTLPWGASVTLKTAYFEDLYAIDPVAELARYSGPVLVAVGTLDPVVSPQPAMGQLFLRYHKGTGEMWTRPMDHKFNTFENAALLDELVQSTWEFIERNGK